MRLLDDAATHRSLLIRLASGCSWTGIAVCLLSVAVVVLVGRDTQYFFVPPTGPGFLRPGELSDAYVQHEASQMAVLQHTWTVETLPAVQANFTRLLDVSQRKTYEQKTAPEERKVVKEAKILLSQFVVTGVDVVRRQGMRRRVLVHGLRTLVIGTTPSTEPVTIDLGLEPDVSTGQPNGLKIMSVISSHPLKIAGR